ncbi:deleted in malignant brain tumors 1 protein [Biomphalaria pfeifferi]|uniref:Deleted in malignant brain tumors 1 protein n=1 Tax=Biomphalaria pfeifferi TaxID=112525 RepID=A0AAD8BAW9_BIOPF|nr:deleted in malignant brain tumors 1 protein [Biomphalaria pfeifferi]
MNHLLNKPRSRSTRCSCYLYSVPTALALLVLAPCILGVKVTRIQLKNGSTVSTRIGRIEIQVDNIDTWGSICDDGWDDKDAVVACRMLGYTNGGKAVLTDLYGTGNYVFLMDGAACTGDEKNLTECIASQTIDCSQATKDVEVGVECNENSGSGGVTPAPATTTTPGSNIISGKCQTVPTVKLYGKQGIDGMGYVQVQAPNGSWGYVCDDNWNEVAAKIVCAQLCYPTNYTAKPGIPAENKLKPVNASIYLDNVQCTGTEATLQDCQHATWYQSDCKKDEDELAGVQCVAATYQPPAPPVPVLKCGQGLMVAQFSRTQDPNLEEKHLSVLSQANCTDVTKSTTTDYVSITIPVDKCGTIISRNGTHILYFNELKYDFTSQEGAITRVNVYRIDITCALPVNEGVTQRVQSVTELVTQKAVGAFTATMEIYRNDSFSIAVRDNPVVVPLGEWLNMAIVMEQYDPRLLLTVTDCLATPTGNKTGTVKQVLIANKCSQESTLSFYPISNFKFGFRFKPFKFVGYDLLYLHCDAIVCIASENIKECDRTCNNTKPNSTAAAGRRKREAGVYYVYTDSKPIILYSTGPSVIDVVTSQPNKVIIASTEKEAVLTTLAPMSQQIQNSISNYEKSSLLLDNNLGNKHNFSLVQLYCLLLICTAMVYIF